MTPVTGGITPSFPSGTTSLPPGSDQQGGVTPGVMAYSPSMPPGASLVYTPAGQALQPGAMMLPGGPMLPGIAHDRPHSLTLSSSAINSMHTSPSTVQAFHTSAAAHTEERKADHEDMVHHGQHHAPPKTGGAPTADPAMGAVMYQQYSGTQEANGSSSAAPQVTRVHNGDVNYDVVLKR